MKRAKTRAKFTDEELLEAQALAAQAAEEAVMVVPPAEEDAPVADRSEQENRLKKVSLPARNAAC